MSFLLVEACDAVKDGESKGTIRVCVSVSRIDDGKPVTGLKKSNFRVASPLGSKDFQIVSVNEWLWETSDVEPAGCYELMLNVTPPPGQYEYSSSWVFGLQAHISDNTLKTPPVECGQTVVSVFD